MFSEVIFKIHYIYSTVNFFLCTAYCVCTLCTCLSIRRWKGDGGGGGSNRARECSAQPEKKYYSKKDTISSQMMSPCKDPLQIGAWSPVKLAVTAGSNQAPDNAWSWDRGRGDKAASACSLLPWFYYCMKLISSIKISCRMCSERSCAWRTSRGWCMKIGAE